MSKMNISVLRDERGLSAIMFVVLLIPLIGMLGLAVDTTRAYSVRHRLQESIDAAALAGGKNFSDPNRNQIITDYFNANWRSGFLQTDTPSLTFTIDPVDRTVTVNALVNMETIFMPVFGIDTVKVGTLASSVSGQTFLEVALALDNTTSMNIMVGGVRRVDAMKTAATNFLNTLYTENAVVQNTIPNQSVSIIPFTSMVNVGQQHGSFLAANSTDNILWDYPKNSTAGKSNQNVWRGCLFERSFYVEGTYAGRDMTDDAPSVEPFWPYHVAGEQFESISICAGNPPTTTTTTSTPTLTVSTSTTTTTTTTTTPPPVCTDDGNVVPCPKVTSSAIKMPALLPAAAIQQAAAACVSANPEAHYGVPGIGNWAGYSIFTPSLSYQTNYGIWIQYALRPADLVIQGYNKLHPGYNNSAVSASKNASGVTVCCSPNNGASQYDAFNTLAWTQSMGRWISPWYGADVSMTPVGDPKIGGWGNSGCGLPMLPLTEDRTKLIAKINEMDVPATSVPSLGYSGTLINQGLVWGWRSVSENWRGWWKNPDGTSIDATVPRDHTTPGVSKAVVVMTDGLNFLPDPSAVTHYSYTAKSFFAQNSIPISLNDPNLATTVSSRINSYATDNSAYGVLRRWSNSNAQYDHKKGLDFCNLSKATGFMPYLAVWGCREYDCMLRNSSNQCVSSNVNMWGPYDVTQALTGPYYNELTRRLLVTCSNMRAQNVRIFFILFDIDANPQKAAAMTAFNTCVGSDGGVYDASDPAALNTAFQDIAIKLRQLRLQQ